MAGERGHAPDTLTWLTEADVRRLDFFAVLRRIEATDAEERLGTARSPREEPVRLGQVASPLFATSTLGTVSEAAIARVPRLRVNFFGLFGPHGPLPLHLTEFVRDRERNHDDPTLASFLDLFHHRLMLLFYRAWANARPIVSRDRPADDRFSAFVGGISGRSDESLDPVELAKLHFAGHYAAATRHADGLESIVSDFFDVPAKVEQFVGGWVDVPPRERWFLGDRNGPRLSCHSTLGSRVWSRDQRFRLTLGPLNAALYTRMLPGGEALGRLVRLVRDYVGDELDWTLRLRLEGRRPFRLGRDGQMGRTSWLGPRVAEAGADYSFDPMTANAPKE